jgi:hypothetical protein
MAAPETTATQRFLHLVTLCAFALAQPLFDLLSRHAPFLVFHRVGPGELYLLAAGLLVLPPVFFLALELAGGALRPALGTGPAMGTTALGRLPSARPGAPRTSYVSRCWSRRRVNAPEPSARSPSARSTCCRDGDGWGIFSGFVPETWITEGRNPVAFFLVRGGPREPRLARVDVRCHGRRCHG